MKKWTWLTIVLAKLKDGDLILAILLGLGVIFAIIVWGILLSSPNPV
jgi:hypothetical protein